MIQKTLIIIALMFIVSQASFGQSCKDTAGQRAAFVGLEPSQKVALWRTHLQNELKNRKLNQDQRNLIRQGLKLLTEDIYINPPTDADFKQFRQDLRANFSLKEGSEIFERLPEYTEVVSSPEAIECNCSTTWTFCNDGTTCSTSCYSGIRCLRVVNCGPFWSFVCNGYCCGK